MASNVIEWLDEISVFMDKFAREVLDVARRHGTTFDVPEGSRWIQLSDTLARELSENLKRLSRGLGVIDVKDSVELNVVRGGAQEQVERGRPAQEQGAGSPDAVAGEESGAVL